MTLLAFGALAERLALIALVTGLASIAAVRALRAAGLRLDRIAPATRAVGLELALALPWIAPVLVVGAALAPSLAALAWPALDHCSVHDDVHDHLCAIHPPHDGSALVVLGLVLAALVLAMRLVPVAARVRRAHAAAEALRARAIPRSDGTHELDTELPLAGVIGVARGAIVVSRGLRARLAAEHVAPVIAHERAHLARRDVLRQTVARVLACAHDRTTARWLLDQLALAREEASDAWAARAVGDPLAVASAILAAARLFPARERAPARDAAIADALDGMVAFGPDALESRVRALTSDPPTEVGMRGWALVALASASAIVAAAPAIHHALESLLARIFP